MRSLRRNARYLKDAVLPPALQISADLATTLAHVDGDGLIVVATPMSGLHEMLRAVEALTSAATPVLWLCKGFQQGTGMLGHEIAEQLVPGRPAGILSGPSFAIEVARGQPTALVVASRADAVCERAVAAFHGDRLAHLHVGRPGRCRGRRCGQERAGDRDRHCRRDAQPGRAR